MRRLSLLAPSLLAACAAGQPPAHDVPAGRTCNAAQTGRFIGQPGTSEIGAEILRATRSAVLRWAPPGYMLTMDYSASRVTVRLNSAYKITAISCG